MSTNNELVVGYRANSDQTQGFGMAANIQKHCSPENLNGLFV